MITASFQYESSLQYRIKALERELESFKSGEKYVKMKEAHRKETKALRKEIKKLEKELARLRREMADAREKWFEVFDDVIREEDGNARNAQAQIEKLRQQCFETDMKRHDEKAALVEDYEGKLAEKDAIIEELKNRLAHSEALLGRDGTNTGTPTGQTPPGKNKVIPNTRRSSGKKKGGQAGHKRHVLEPPSEDQVDETAEYRIDEDRERCPVCDGENLVYTGKTEEKFETDVEIRVRRKKHVYYLYECADCGTVVKTCNSPDLRAGNQYGPNVQAIALSLMNTINAPINKVPVFLSAITGGQVSPCQGYIAKLQKRASKGLADFKKDLRLLLLTRRILYWDDTVIPIMTKRACLRFYGDDRISYYTAHMKKDLAGLLEDGILNFLTEDTYVMHDHNKVNYNEKFRFRNLECCQHAERDIQACADETKHEEMAMLKELLAEAIKERNDLFAASIMSFSEERIARFDARLEELLSGAEAKIKEHFNPYSSRDELNVIKRLRDFHDNFFAWMRDFSLPHTNNLSLCELLGYANFYVEAGSAGGVLRKSSHNTARWDNGTTNQFTGGDSMTTFHNNSKIVLDYLEKHDEKPKAIRLHRSCYSQIGAFLEENRTGYSYESALEWLRGQTGPKALMGTYAAAVTRINDVYQSGHVRFQHRVRKKLCAAFESVVEEYLEDVSGQYSEKHLPNIRTRCRFLLFFMEMERRKRTIEAISYADILAFCQEALADLCRADSCMYKGTAMEFLSWLASRGKCTRGFSLLLFNNRAEKALSLESMPPESAKAVLELKEPSFRDFPPEEFYEAAAEFCADLDEFGYARTMMLTSRTTFDLLFVFLDMNRLGYDPAIAREWFRTAHVFFGANSCMVRRTLSLFEDFTQNGKAHPEVRFIYKKKLCESLPEWSRTCLYSFLEQKKMEGKAASTVVMYRSAITRFCQFLEKEGLSSFDELTARHLKDFNISDRHGSAEGKNAYNVRIRKFLLYLAMQGVLSNWFLGEALPCASAPKTRVVQVLSEAEYESLENYECGTDEALRLRNRAIVLMGLKMGLRISDIVSLEMGQIDWKGAAISIVQEKTGVGKLFPMPVEVGNALYRYLTEGRPRSGPGDSHVFITHKAPYRKITRSVCGNIMDKAIPKGQGGARPGFHATRKTYATGRFRSGCGFPEVADLLGHSSNDTVWKYISLDEERMRMCPIPMEAAGISMKGGFRHG